jgi:hypothetical protein
MRTSACGDELMNGEMSSMTTLARGFKKVLSSLYHRR